MNRLRRPARMSYLRLEQDLRHQGLQAQAPIRGQWLLRKTIFLWKKNEKDLPPPYNKLLNLHHILKNATI